MNADLLQGFYLGDLLIEPLKGQVTGRAGSRNLPPKAVEVLLCLARTPGELVARDTLLEAAWGPGGGSTEALSHTISDIRNALNDDAADPVFIQTVPRLGYRLAVTPQLDSEHTGSIVIGAQGGATVDDIGFLESLTQRGVIETAIAYAILGWLLIQVADVVFAQLGFPPWTARFVTVLVIAGFPLALVLSWFLEFRDGRAVLDDLPPAAARRRRFSRTYTSVVGSLAIAAVLVYVYDLTVGLPKPERVAADVALESQLPPIVENSIAVLPFMNLDGSRETQIFANGLMEDVLTQLSRVSGLRVASRGDSATMQPNSASQDVRRRLRVEMYLEGSVDMNAEEMRVTVQLINTEDGFHILSRRFDRPREDFFDVRDEITSLTVANVRVALPPDVSKSPLIGRDPSLDAYALYRRGVEASRQPKTIDAIASALDWFDEALAVDPEYAAAHAGKCAVYVEGYSEVDDPSFVDKAKSSCSSALALNPNLEMVHTALGDLYKLLGELDDAESEYLKAQAIDPSNVESLVGLGEVYSRQGRLQEAEESLSAAVGKHPGDFAAYTNLGSFLYGQGRFEEAAEQFKFAVALTPDNMNGHSNLATTYMMMGDFAAAAPAFEKAIEIRPTTTALSNLGLMHYYQGNLDLAIEAHRRAVELEPNDHLTHSNFGDTLWAAERFDEARSEFEIAASLAQDDLRVNPADPYTLMDLAWISAMLDKHDEARDLMDRALTLAEDDPYTHYLDALVLLRAGDSDAALDALETATEKGYSRRMLAGDPQLMVLRKEPQFHAIIGRQ